MYEKYNVYKDTVQLEKNKLLIIKETIRNDYENRLINKNIINEKEKAIIRVNYEYRIYTMIALTIFIFIISTYIIRIKNITNRKKLDSLLAKINLLKHQSNVLIDTKKFKLNRKKIELTINKKLNETDWNILLILLKNPEATNKEISEQAFLSIDGIGSALRRMYIYFDVKETNYKKVSLIKNAIEICNLSKTI
jgi:DNA-binding CsgD family transcriptional regulator